MKHWLMNWWSNTKTWLALKHQTTRDDFQCLLRGFTGFVAKSRTFIGTQWKQHRQKSISFIIGFGLLVTVVIGLLRSGMVTTGVDWAGGAIYGIIALALIIKYHRPLWRWGRAAFLLLAPLALIGYLGYWTFVQWVKHSPTWWWPLAIVGGILLLVMIVWKMMSGSSATSGAMKSSEAGPIAGLLMAIEGLAWIATALSIVWWGGSILMGLDPTPKIPIGCLAVMMTSAFLRFIFVRQPGIINAHLIFGVTMVMTAVMVAGTLVKNYVTHPTQHADPMMSYHWILGAGPERDSVMNGGLILIIVVLVLAFWPKK